MSLIKSSYQTLAEKLQDVVLIFEATLTSSDHCKPRQITSIIRVKVIVMCREPFLIACHLAMG